VGPGLLHRRRPSGRRERATSFSRRHFPLELVGEVHEEDHVALRLLPFRRLRRHQRGDALAVRRKIVVAGKPEVREPFVRPQSRLVREKRISRCLEWAESNNRHSVCADRFVAGEYR